MIRADLIIDGAAEVVTCASPGSIDQGEVGSIQRGAVACAVDRIVFVGTSDACGREVELSPGGRRLDARGGVVLPGFVDPHTHLPFGGWRAAEFAMRLAGATYLEIAAAGGGILSTVRATRAVPVEDLAALVRGRLDQMLLAGTTTVEAKSGYGLSTESEIAILRALRLASDHHVEIEPTFLGAHVVAPEFREGRRGDYVRLLVDDVIPQVAREHLARFCDVFVDQGAFTLEEAEEILQSASRHGLGLRLHAEQLTHTGAAVMGASLGAFSVDHLERLTEQDIALLSESWKSEERSSAHDSRSSPDGRGSGRRGTVAILLPGATHTLRETVRPPARRLIGAGIPVALATDFNPGTSPCLAIPPILNLACVLLAMTPDEAIVAVTRHAALSLGLEDRIGSIEPGKQADLVVWGIPDRAHLSYRFGPIPCQAVVKRGRIVVDEGAIVGSSGAGWLAPPSVARDAMLVDLKVREFLDVLASDKPAPGGGSASALAGAQAAALVEMVAALTMKSEKFASSRPVLEPLKSRAAAFRADLCLLVDRDAEAYNGVVAANRLPKESEEEKAVRQAARERALQFAAEVPLKTAELSCAVAALADKVAPHANPRAASDLLVAAELARAALAGAAANVRINLNSLKSPSFAVKANERLEAWSGEAAASAANLLERFNPAS